MAASSDLLVVVFAFCGFFPSSVSEELTTGFTTGTSGGLSSQHHVIIGATVGSAVVLLVMVSVIVAIGVYFCRKKKSRSMAVKVGDGAFSNITYGKFSGNEEEVQVDANGLPMQNGGLVQSHHNSRMAVIPGFHLERPRSYSHSTEQESVQVDPKELSYVSVRRGRYYSLANSSQSDVSYSSVDHEKSKKTRFTAPNIFKSAKTSRTAGSGTSLIPTPYEHPVSSLSSRNTEELKSYGAAGTGSSLHPSPYENPVLSLDSRRTEELQNFSITSQGGTYYQEPAGNEQSLYCQLREQDMEQSHTTVVLGTYLGCGQFGEVFKGVWLGPDGRIDAAIKTLKEDAAKEDKIRFLQEAAIMGQFKHPNVVAMYGVVVNDNKVFIAMELLQEGNLLVHLRSLRDAGEVAETLLLDYSRQTACGMHYLSGLGFIHRDLAARNILLNNAGICKIADFGMSRDLMEGSYYISHGGQIPVKWTAPEALNYQKYSSASDVWSYGALLFEIWSVGHKPFEGVVNRQILSLLESGVRLPPPPGCSRSIYHIMVSCWHPEASNRPTFEQLLKTLYQTEQELLTWAEADTPTHPQARKIGSSLKHGNELYKDLQHQYLQNQSELDESIHEQIAFVN